MTNTRGYTLIEMVIVIVVIAILAGSATVAYRLVVTDAKVTEFKPILKQAITLYEVYYDQHDTYKTPTGDIKNGNRDIRFKLPKGESRFDYSSVETDSTVIVTARLKKKVGDYKAGMGADLDQDLRQNTVTKDIPW